MFVKCAIAIAFCLLTLNGNRFGQSEGFVSCHVSQFIKLRTKDLRHGRCNELRIKIRGCIET